MNQKHEVLEHMLSKASYSLFDIRLNLSLTTSLGRLVTLASNDTLKPTDGI